MPLSHGARLVIPIIHPGWEADEQGSAAPALPSMSITTWLFQRRSPQKACCGYILLNTVNKTATCPDRQYELFSSSWLDGLSLVAYHQIQAQHFVRA